MVNVNFNNALLQQKIQPIDKKESLCNLNYSGINDNKINNIKDKIVIKNMEKNKLKEKIKEYSKSCKNIFDLKSYSLKVEKMNKKLEDSFIKERDRCLNIVETEDENGKKENSSVVLTNQNINYFQVYILYVYKYIFIKFI